MQPLARAVVGIQRDDLICTALPTTLDDDPGFHLPDRSMLPE